MKHKWIPCWLTPEIDGSFCAECEHENAFYDDPIALADCKGQRGVYRGDVFYRCLGCGRNRFTRINQPHKCNGQYRSHSFPAGFEFSDWQPE